MNIQFAAKKIDGTYEAALIVDNRFARSGKSTLVSGAFEALVGPLLGVEHPEGTEVAITVTVLTPADIAKLQQEAK